MAGPRYGIEFKGGMLMTVRFADDASAWRKFAPRFPRRCPSPPVFRLLKIGSNEIEIGTEGADDQTLAKNRQIVLDTLAKTFGQPGNGKLDLNNASARPAGGPSARSSAEAPVFSFPILRSMIWRRRLWRWRDQHGGLCRALTR